MSLLLLTSPTDDNLWLLDCSICKGFNLMLPAKHMDFFFLRGLQWTDCTQPWCGLPSVDACAAQ